MMIHPHLNSDCTAIVLKQLRLIFKDRTDTPEKLLLPFREVVEEIAQDLGIPQEKVENVIATVVHLQLLSKTDDLLQIPDIDALRLYTSCVNLPDGDSE